MTNRMRRRLAIGIPAVVIMCAGLWLYSWINKPATSTLGVQTITTSDNQSLAAPIATKDLNGQYFTTKLPDTMVVKTHSTKPKGVALEQVLITNVIGRFNDQLGISIFNLPNDGLTGVSDVMLRQRTDDYESIALEWAPAGVLAFHKKSGYEYSVFWPKKGRYAAIVVSGTMDRQVTLDDVMDRVLRSWRWL